MIEKTITIKATKNWQSKPTKPGVYLMRDSEVKDRFIFVYKSAFGLSLIHDNGSIFQANEAQYSDCKWFGPIKL